jgi:hypothetical protein
MRDNHPSNALRVPFKPLIGKRTIYFVWSKDNKFYWSTLGQSGTEVTLEAAMRAAREYILYGVNGMKSHGEYRGVFDESRQQSN